MQAIRRVLLSFLFPSRYDSVAQKSRDAEDQSLLPEPGTDGKTEESDTSNLAKRTASFSVHTIILGVMIICNLVFMGEIFRLKSKLEVRCPANLLFSPAEEAIEYEIIKFHGGRVSNEEENIYSLPPSPEVDKAWRALYQNASIGIPPEMNSKFVNQTEMKDESGEFLIVSLDVFHQLHCLDMIRRDLYPDYYAPIEKPFPHAMHISHCLDSIRQSLQCSSDISVIPFTNHTINGLFDKPDLFPSFNVVHSCRNFGRIREWVTEKFVRAA